MAIIEPPPKAGLPDVKPDVSFIDTELTRGRQHACLIRKARVEDVGEILSLINEFAALNLMLPRGPQYLYENIRDFVVAADAGTGHGSGGEASAAKKPIVACGSLHVLWNDIGEIRAMAIHPDHQNRGIGGLLIAHMKTEAHALGLKLLFTFTLAEDFFAHLGFSRRNRDDLPAKVWGECSRCPKYFKCDEIGMVLDL